MIWTGWSLSEDGKTLTIYFFDKKSGVLKWTGKFTFRNEIGKDQAYLEALRYQMVENEQLPIECATTPLNEVMPLMQEIIVGSDPKAPDDLKKKLKTIHDSTRPEIMDTILKNAREHFDWIHSQSAGSQESQ